MIHKSFSNDSIELPRYKCHKEVWALKIKAIGPIMYNDRSPEDSALITPEDSRYRPFHVGLDYLCHHNPSAGGYYVVYEDGYESFSPASAFENGYTLIDNAKEISNDVEIVDPPVEVIRNHYSTKDPS